MRYTVAVLLLAPIAVPAVAQATPVEHRLTPAEIAAAQADGETRSHAAELLAMTRGEPGLLLPAERPRKWHGTAEVGIGSNGYRSIGGELTTSLGDGGTATVAGQYGQLNAPFRLRQPNR